MQFNFWRFTSDTGTNIIIAAAIWFVLSIICQRSCSKGQGVHPGAYLGYAIASFGMAITSVVGVYGITIAAPFLFIGIIIVLVSSRRSEPKYYPTEKRVTTPTPREQQPKPASDSQEVTCSECGKEVSIRGGTVKPDGSVVCPYCFKRFFP